MTSRLRYPVAPIYDTTDYLQINIVEYKSVTTNRRDIDTNTANALVGSPGSRKNGKKLNSVITLPIPSNVVDNNAVSYQDNSLNALAAALAGGSIDVMEGLGSLFDGQGTFEDKFKTLGGNLESQLATAGFKGDAGLERLRDLITKQLAAQAAGIFGGNVSVNQLLARQNGTIFNPNMELLFNGPTLRSFRFQFKMTPRNPDEGDQVKRIINTFKKSMAPIVSTEGSENLYLKTPNVFELTYKQGNQDHSFLHKFKQCFLENVSVNYTGEGTYATYGDGTPVSMTMDLQFKELEPLYDVDYKDIQEGVGY